MQQASQSETRASETCRKPVDWRCDIEGFGDLLGSDSHWLGPARMVGHPVGRWERLETRRPLGYF